MEREMYKAGSTCAILFCYGFALGREAGYNKRLAEFNLRIIL